MRRGHQFYGEHSVCRRDVDHRNDCGKHNFYAPHNFNGSHNNYYLICSRDCGPFDQFNAIDTIIATGNIYPTVRWVALRFEF